MHSTAFKVTIFVKFISYFQLCEYATHLNFCEGNQLSQFTQKFQRKNCDCPEQTGMVDHLILDVDSKFRL